MGNVFDSEYRTTPLDLVQRCHSDLHGKTALITGCTTGMGPELARTLASAGATAFICGRDERALTVVRDGLNAELKAAGRAESVQSLVSDLSSLRSVQAGAAEFLRRSPQLHLLLVINAGLMQQPFQLTEDGMESMLQVNNAAHWLLFRLLKDTLLSSAPGRVVVVVSAAFWMFGQPRMDYSRLPPQQPSAERYDNVIGYQQSKPWVR